MAEKEINCAELTDTVFVAYAQGDDEDLASVGGRWAIALHLRGCSRCIAAYGLACERRPHLAASSEHVGMIHRRKKRR